MLKCLEINGNTKQRFEQNLDFTYYFGIISINVSWKIDSDYILYSDYKNSTESKEIWLNMFCCISVEDKCID